MIKIKITIFVIFFLAGLAGKVDAEPGWDTASAEEEHTLLFEEGKKAFQQGKYEAAIAIFQEIVGDDDDDDTVGDDDDDDDSSPTETNDGGLILFISIIAIVAIVGVVVIILIIRR